MSIDGESIKESLGASLGLVLMLCVLCLAGYGGYQMYKKYSSPPVTNSCFYGIWQANVSQFGDKGKFVLLLNNDTTFSFSTIMNASNTVTSQISGKYRMTTPKTIGLSDNAGLNNGYYKFAFSGRDTLALLWVSGFDFMNASSPTTTTWVFYKQ